MRTDGEEKEIFAQNVVGMRGTEKNTERVAMHGRLEWKKSA